MWTFWAKFEEFSKQASQRFQTGGYGIREFKIGFLGNGVLSGKHQGRKDLDWNMGRVEEREVRCCENWSPFMCVHCVCLIRFTENFQLWVLNFTIIRSWHWYWIPDMNPKLGSKKYTCFFSLSRQYKSVSFKQSLNLGMMVVILGFTFEIFWFLPCWSLMDGLHTIVVFSTVSIKSAIFPFCYKEQKYKFQHEFRAQGQISSSRSQNKSLVAFVFSLYRLHLLGLGYMSLKMAE
jgi:hypothetical protein